MRATRFVIAIALSCAATFGADWLTDGGNAQVGPPLPPDVRVP